MTSDVTHRIQNFAEDVFLALRDENLGAVPNMDTAVNEVHVEVVATRHMGRVLQIIRSALRRHRFENAIVSRRRM